jgi:MCP family monocarboxylic acid transporter-like MFS transporter 10
MTAYSENGFITRPPSNSTTITELSSIEKAQEKGEGDRQGWLTVIGSLLVYYSSYGLVDSFGFFQDFYHDEFLVATPASTIAFIGTLQIALVNCLATVSGALCDSYGVKVRFS